MRYTEARLSALAMEMLRDIDKDTVDFVPNFDESLEQPAVLPSRFPNLLVNGASGIAVGMATNIPPHNLREIVDGLINLIDTPDITIKELNKVIKGPDFPTGGIILGKDGIREAYLTGRGRIRMRARAAIEELAHGKTRIVVTELPYQVNKANLIERIAALVGRRSWRGSRTCGMSRTGRGCGSSLNSGGMPSPGWSSTGSINTPKWKKPSG